MGSQTTLVEQLYEIGEVTARTGVTPAALRMWERRYGAVVPARSERGRRLYSAEEVERLALLRRATQAGFMIGAIAHLSNEALAALPELGKAPPDAAADQGEAAVARDLLHRTLAACKALDASGARAALHRARRLHALQAGERALHLRAGRAAARHRRDRQLRASGARRHRPDARLAARAAAAVGEILALPR